MDDGGPRNLVARRNERRGFASAEGHVEKVFDSGLASFADGRQIQGQGISAARRRTQARQPAGSGHGAVGQDLPRSIEARQVTERVAVLDRNPPAGQIDLADPNRLVHLLDLPGMRMQLPVRGHQSVHQKVPVVAHPRRAEVTPIRPVFPASLVGGAHRLVHPVPDKAALQPSQIKPPCSRGCESITAQ